MAEALSESETRYRSVVEDQTEFIVRWLPDGKRTFVNEAYCRYFGVTPEECRNTNYMDLISGEDREKVRQRIAALTPDAPCSSDEHRVLRPDGSVSWTQWTDRGIFDGGGELVELQSVGRDVTDRKRAEEEAEQHRHDLTEAQKMIALGRLAAGDAHEIKKRNQFIRLSLRMLQDAWQSAQPILDEHHGEHPDLRIANLPYEDMRDEVPELIRELLKGGERIKRILSELRDYAREPRAETGPVDLNAVVRSALTLLASPIRKATHKFTVDYAKPLPAVEGNLWRLEQVVITLVLNACRALPGPDKAVTIRTGHDKARGLVHVTVADEGCGIPAESMPRIRDPFYTTWRDQGGTGLGLAVASRIVSNHNGSLSFDSEVGAGTTVRVTIPEFDEAID